MHSITIGHILCQEYRGQTPNRTRTERAHIRILITAKSILGQRWTEHRLILERNLGFMMGPRWARDGPNIRSTTHKEAYVGPTCASNGPNLPLISPVHSISIPIISHPSHKEAGGARVTSENSAVDCRTNRTMFPFLCTAVSGAWAVIPEHMQKAAQITDAFKA